MSDTREVSLTCARCGDTFLVEYSPYAPEKTITCETCGFSIPLPQEGMPRIISKPQVAIPIAQPVRARPRRTSLFGRLVAGVVGGSIVTTLGYNIFMLVATDPMKKEPGPLVLTLAWILAVILIATCVTISVRSVRPAKAWRRMLIPSGILSFLFPLAFMVPTLRATGQSASSGADLEAGFYAIGGTVVAIVLGFFGVILGTVFLVIGLLVGKDVREPLQ